MSEEERRRLRELFSYALVLVTVLGASGFVFVAATRMNHISDIKYYFWVFTYPIVVLLIVWVMTGLISGQEVSQDASHVRIQNFTRNLIAFFTIFCWFFWATVLVYFLNVFFYLLTGSYSLFMIILTAIVYVILVHQIESASVRAVGRDYYTPRRIWAFTAFGVFLSWYFMFLYTLVHFA
jgi:hypothetical protein